MSNEAAAPDNWAKTDPAIVKEIVRQAELQIQSQTLTAQSYDQRGTSMAALTNGGAVAVLVFAGTQAATTTGLPLPVAIASLALSITWFISASFAFQAAKPRKWVSAGTWPKQWYRPVKEHYREADLLGALIEKLQEYCEANDSRNMAAGKALRRSLKFAMASPFIAIILFFLALSPWVGQAAKAVGVGDRIYYQTHSASYTGTSLPAAALSPPASGQGTASASAAP